MGEYRAANLPTGSVVADMATAWIKTEEHTWDDRSQVWRPGGWSDDQMDAKLGDGAEVLRVGTGQEG